MPVESFKIEHLQRLEMREQELRKLKADPRAAENINALTQLGMGGALVYDDIVVAIFGYFELWPGVFEVWAFPSIHVKKYSMLYLRTVKRYIRVLEKSHTVHRLQTTSIDDQLHNDWMKFLGFKCETPNGMEDYSVLKERYNLWSKTYGGNDDGA